MKCPWGYSALTQGMVLVVADVYACLPKHDTWKEWMYRRYDSYALNETGWKPGSQVAVKYPPPSPAL